MNKCPYKLRVDIPPPPARCEHLPISERGYPVPFFAGFVDGRAEFRLVHPSKIQECLEKGKCWVCGKTMTQPLCFVVGPMCAVNRVTAEPPTHVECAEWSAQACPFITKPQMTRREDEFTAEHKCPPPGVSIERNPGVTCLWHTRTFRLFDDGAGGMLINMGAPERVTWWREGRAATREEVLAPLESGLALLLATCGSDEERRELREARAAVDPFLPLTQTGETP